MDWPFIAALLAIAFVVNVPLGKWRSLQRKRSPKWFLAIHLSVPLIIFLRMYWGIPLYLIPVSVASAVAGQAIGGRIPSLGFLEKSSP